MMTWKTYAPGTALMVSLGTTGAGGGCTRNSNGTESFGEVGGRKAHLYTLRNTRGMTVKVSDYGALVTEVHVPDRHGDLADVVLGHSTAQGYVDHSPYFGALVGRVANRIAKGTFALDGKTYSLATNNGNNHLHGGLRGFDKAMWRTDGPQDGPDGQSLSLLYVSADGDEGYPGTVKAEVTYTVTEDNALKIEMTAVTDKPTLVNLAHHGYWNLAGHGQGSILEHELQLHADSYTPNTRELFPRGVIEPVAETPFDFRDPKLIGRDIGKLPDDAKGGAGGYDVNFVVRGDPRELRPVATLRHRASGRQLALQANMPGVQFYSGNFLNGIVGKSQTRYDKHGGLCLETQYFPNAINVSDDAWQKPILRPGETYRHIMVHTFSVDTDG